MDFAILPPEVNSGRMYAGPGAGPMLAAAAAWDGLAAELQSTTASYRSAIDELTGGPWLGSSSASMAAATAPYLDWMTTASGQAEHTATQARAAAAAYGSAFSMTVPPAVVAANRSLVATLIATNVLGQNTAAIAATETEYAEMWAQDAAAMYGYASSSSAASTLTPFTSPPPTTNPAGQSAAVSQSLMSTGSRVINAVPQALQGLATSSAAAPADPLSDLLSAISPALTALEIPIGTTSIGSSATSISAAFTGVFTNFRGFSINADRDFASGRGPYTGYGPGAANLPNWFLNGQGSVAAPSDAATASARAGLGQANTVGRLSVPANWTIAAPEIRPVAYTLPITSAMAAPEVGGANNLFSNMGLAGAAGGAVGSTASVGRGDHRVKMTPRESPKPTKQPPNEAVTAIATELQELATRAQSLLAKLADSGLMTTEEVIEHKRRFLR
jgi:PPE-repeat protein